MTCRARERFPKPALIPPPPARDHHYHRHHHITQVTYLEIGSGCQKRKGLRKKKKRIEKIERKRENQGQTN